MDTLAVTGYDADWIAVNGVRHKSSLILSALGLLKPWDKSHFDQLQDSDLAQLLALKDEGIELIVLGTGAKLRFLPPAWLKTLQTQHLGVECMDTPAACRTYNILAGEGRRVAAALLLQTSEAVKHSNSTDSL